jgi:phenylacetate-CoA ligase
VAIEPENQPYDLEIPTEDYFAEVIDPQTEKPVVEGSQGELVLTNLGRFGSPLIRYRTGDIVKGVRNQQGNLILKGGILGRADDMIQVRGNNVYPSALETIIRRFPEVVEFRIIARTQQSLGDILIEIELSPENPSSEAEVSAKIAHAIKTELLFRTEVTVVPYGTLPRPEMKARRFFRQ